MNKYDLNDIYGVDIGMYCKRLGTTPEKLIEDKHKEIEMLQENYDRLIERRNDMSIAVLCSHVNTVINSKRKKIKRIEQWRSKRDLR
ncbi:hypothetical protein [Hydrogenimonas sp.]